MQKKFVYTDQSYEKPSSDDKPKIVTENFKTTLARKAPQGN